MGPMKSFNPYFWGGSFFKSWLKFLLPLGLIESQKANLMNLSSSNVQEAFKDQKEELSDNSSMIKKEETFTKVEEKTTEDAYNKDMEAVMLRGRSLLLFVFK